MDKFQMYTNKNIFNLELKTLLIIPEYKFIQE